MRFLIVTLQVKKSSFEFVRSVHFLSLDPSVGVLEVDLLFTEWCETLAVAVLVACVMELGGCCDHCCCSGGLWSSANGYSSNSTMKSIKHRSKGPRPPSASLLFCIFLPSNPLMCANSKHVQRSYQFQHMTLPRVSCGFFIFLLRYKLNDSCVLRIHECMFIIIFNVKRKSIKNLIPGKPPYQPDKCLVNISGKSSLP